MAQHIPGRDGEYTAKQLWRMNLSPERLATLRARDRAYQAARKEVATAYRAAHRDQRAEYDRSPHRAEMNRMRVLADPWRKARYALKNARIKARKYGLALGTLTKEDFARLHLLPCVYCGQMPAMGADHVVSMARGGPNSLANLVPACWPCNDAKGLERA